jgi:hypothetical protein
MHLIKIRRRGTATSSGHIFNIDADIPSKPWAFLLSSFFIIDTILLKENETSEIELFVRRVKVGSVDSILKGWH